MIVQIIISLLYLFAFIYVISILYLEVVTNRIYLKICTVKPKGFKRFLFYISGYNKKINCIYEQKGKDPEIEKALWLDGIVKKLSLIILGLIIALIIFKKEI